MESSTLVLQAPAKINLGLRIGPLRPDGYHDICSVFQEITLCDELLLHDTPDSSLSLSCDSTDLPSDDTNLCLKATKLLQSATGCRRGAHLILKKRIPIGAGLGGGSSDAAAVLKGLNQLWHLQLDQATLLNLAGQVGSDVPFFILGGCCLATGRGEILRKIDLQLTGAIVLVVPPVFISTAWAYKNLDNYRLTQKEEIIRLWSFSEIDLQQPERFQHLVNDFEPVILAYYPELQALKEQLLLLRAYFTSLSGSGSALYGIFPTSEIADQAMDQLSEAGLVYQVEIKRNEK